MRTFLPTLRPTLLTAALLTVPAAQAQPVQSTSAPQVLTLGQKSSALLRLPILDKGLPQGGYLLKRSGPGGEKTITVKPLNKAEALNKHKVPGDDYDLAVGALSALKTAQPAERGYILLNILNTLSDASLARSLGLLIEDAGLAPGQYSYSVSADGQSLGSVTVQVGRETPLPTPSALKVSPSMGRAQLSWERGDPQTYLFRVQRALGNGEFADLRQNLQLVNKGETPRLEDFKLDPKQTYRYRVIAQDFFGRQSAPSAAVSLEARLTAPLVAPVLRGAAGKQNQVELSWPRITDPSIKEIIVLRGDKPGKPAQLTRLPASATSYTDKTAKPAEHRYYSLKVSDGTRTSTASPELVGRAYNETPPAAPSGLKANASENSISLSWLAGRENDLYGYNLYRAEVGLDGKADLVRLNGEVLKTTIFKDAIPQGVQNRFQYVVRAVNTTGIEGAASEPVTAALADQTPPDAPLLLRVQAGEKQASGQVALVFTLAPTPDLKEFQIYRADEQQAKPQKIATLPATSIGYVDSKLSPGEQYSYAVVAVDNAGNSSAASNVLSTRTPQAKLGAAEGPKVSVNNGQVTLSWGEQPGAVGYYVFRSVNGKRLQVAGPLGELKYQEPAVKGAKYSIQAVNDQGLLGTRSAEVEAR